MANESEFRPPESEVSAAAAREESETRTEPRTEEERREPPEPQTGTSAPRTDIVYCVRCGGVMGRGDRFCHACGWDVRAEPPPPRRIEVNPSDRNRLAALLLCLLLGWLGAHRFYCGKVGTGLVWLFTLGFFGIGVIYDLVLIATGEFRDIDGRRLVRWE